MTNQHGGARPKVRNDDARGKHHSSKPGSGRQPTTMRMKIGDKFYVGIVNGGVWTVETITRTSIEFADEYGGKHKLIR